MARKSIRRRQIRNERKRNAVFTKRVEGLTKKANDLSVLCGVDIGLVVHRPAENNAVLWPCREVFHQRLQKFLDFPDSERSKKMVIHENYLDQRLKDERDDVAKSLTKVNSRESVQLLSELVIQGRSLDQVDLVQLNGLRSYAADVLQKLANRDEAVSNQQETLHWPPPPPLP